MIRSESPVVNVLAKPVMNRVVMYVVHQIGEVAFVFYFFTPHVVNKQSAFAFIFFVVGFGIRVKQIAEALHYKV